MQGLIERNFLRFRKRGDVKALGRVFDASAPELWRVARYLCKDPSDAEDALQATYQTVLEQKDAYDAKLRLMPWMLGILANHAKRLHRQQGREIDPSRLHAAPPAEPSQVVADREFRLLVEGSLAELPDNYAAAVRPYLESNQSPAEIAASLGITSNAARVRLHRGLKLLRQSLPAAGVLGPLQAAPESMPAAVAARLRLHLLQSAESASLVGASTASTGILTGALFMSQTFSILATATVVAASTYWLTHNAQHSQIEALQREIDALRQEASLEPALVSTPQPSTELVAPTQPRTVAAPAVDAPTEESSTQPLGPEEWLARLEQASTPREARQIAYEIYALEDGLSIMLAIYSRISRVPYRQQVLKPWVFEDHEGVLSLLHLAATDPSLEVQRTGFEYLRFYAWADLSASPEAYGLWRARFAGSDLKTVVQTCVREWGAGLHQMDPQSRAAHIAVMGQFHLYAKHANNLGIDLREELFASGFGDLLRGWIAAGDTADLAAQGLRLLQQLSPSESYLRLSALPIITNPNAYDAALLEAAWDALAQPGATWATEPILQSMLQVPAESLQYFSASRALAEIGDPTAIPTMIAMIVADDSYATQYGVGYFGLSKLTGVSYHESHDGAWWLNWWNTNQSRLPAEIRGMSIPTVVLPTR